MSELKAIRSGEIYNIIEYEDCYRTDDLYYPKSEADKAIAEKDKEIAELKEERRWRKSSEELPEKGQRVLFLAKYKTDKVKEWIGEFRNVDFYVFYASAPGWGCEFLPNEIFGWMPLPSAPKEQA